MNIKSWREADGDNTYALDWPLTESSHVWEIGGFEGRWAQQMWDKYHCHITIFEPQLWAVDRMRKRFAGIDKITIHPYGLWLDDCNIALGASETDGASLFATRPPWEVVKMRNIHEVIAEHPPEVDLALMNIEGAEYDLLPELILENEMRFFKNFWCQFHPGHLSRDHDAGRIFADLEQTHKKIWDFFPTATAWRKK